MNVTTIDRLLIAHVAVGVTASFICPPLSAACMGGAVYLLRKRDQAVEEEVIETLKSQPKMLRDLWNQQLNRK